MAGANPTFSESWYRVATLRPRLRATVQTRRQHFRGQIWHIIQDPANNSFFRLHAAAYRFVALLDGRRTVADAWRACHSTMGDDALTQTEAIGVLGQLYSANLIQADLPPDAEGLFRRHRKRRGRELKSWLANILFVRIPVFDPNRLLGALDAAVGWLFSPIGFLLWLALLATGAYFAVSAWGELARKTSEIVNSEALLAYLPAMYGAMVLTKAVHELGHGVACKRFGRRTRDGGEVHVMGVMLLIFAPMPYADASSAWAMRSKLHRCIVGAAGMMSELALAAIAAVVWVWTAGSAEPWQIGLNAASYYTMFISSISTLLFNANFLLRFDGYYILSDLLEIPNLAERSKQYLLYLVRRYAYGVRGVTNPSQSAGERAWLLLYGLASTPFKIYLSVRIILFLSERERFFEIGLVVGAAMAVIWLVIPAGRSLRYLVADMELERTRIRALAVTAAALLPAAALLVLPDAADHWQLEGQVEPVNLAYIYAGADGFVATALANDSQVQGPDANGNGGSMLISAYNHELAQDANDLDTSREITTYRRRIAQIKSKTDTHNLALVQVLDASLDSLDKQRALAKRELSSLNVRSPLSGRWLSDRADFIEGAYLKKGQRIGKVAALDQLRIVAKCPHHLAAMALEEAKPTVEIRLVGRPEVLLTGTWEIRPAGARGEDDRPVMASALETDSPVHASGSDSGNADDEPFEMIVIPSGENVAQLLSGESVMIQISLARRPILLQWWRSFRQMAGRRLGIF